MDLKILEDQLTLDEGVRPKPYTDSTGNITIGRGRNLTAVGLRPNEIEYLYLNDVNEVLHDLDTHLPWWRDQDDVRQRALADLCFNMGISTLLTFHVTLSLWKDKQYEQAAYALTRSRWYTQVGRRGPRIVDMVLTGLDAWRKP